MAGNEGTEFLNPGFTSVLGADPLYFKIAKQLQWTFLEILSEVGLMVMLGELHNAYREKIQ